LLMPKYKKKKRKKEKKKHWSSDNQTKDFHELTFLPVLVLFFGGDIVFVKWGLRKKERKKGKKLFSFFFKKKAEAMFLHLRFKFPLIFFFLSFLSYPSLAFFQLCLSSVVNANLCVVLDACQIIFNTQWKYIQISHEPLLHQSRTSDYGTTRNLCNGKNDYNDSWYLFLEELNPSFLL
jgi:hypothetical protein